MVTDILFPFYDVLVNNIFGSIGLAIVALAAIIAIILFLCRTGWTFLVFWLMFYFLVMSVMYVGALGLVLSFFIVAAYVIVSLMRLVAGTWLNI